ncbi:serine/threonine-protein kinase 33 [Daktulosphaira vitifoliae]|uniref:serine/threonine-protein kinase 33 n=1 Tax=Daktulosphaira vitifoliae TaxID=58002 RepID=UPI0021A9B062|nr:serine/threonine-protein kinase 33 [Daktulosphaira vitifoliae]XP_050542980.1 serine/threonine-protein kinase 33 [Daktulosphaira vitifoliae]XP_050542988.1 serine/threonine-protein kinase 33 [Daktulosphaira vitifoliae]
MNGNYWPREPSLGMPKEFKYPAMVADERLAYWAHFHNYQLGDKIGEGSFGKVFKALHTKSNTVVAFKFIYKLDEWKTLQQEVDIQQKLHHPNIVKMIESFGNESGIALVMEFVPRSLKEIIEFEGILSEDRTRNIICQLVSALHYLHKNNILHRDLKPPNILLDHNDTAKLCDFGLARLMLTGTQVLTQASLKGTPLYMAPEVINSPIIPPTYNHNADLWSLGCIAYHLLCGKPPFNTKCLMHLVQMMKDQPIVWPKTVSPACQNFLEQLLQKNPLERLTWPALLHHDFVKNRVYTLNQYQENIFSSQLDDIVSPLNTMKINEELQSTDSSASQDSTSIDNTTEEDLRSSQSSWCSETCPELDICSNKTNSTSNNTNNNDFMSEEWIVFLRQSASEVLSGNVSSINQKSFILVVLSSLNSTNVSSKLLHYVVTLLTLPFVTPNIQQNDKVAIKQIYIESNVIRGLMKAFSNAFKLTVRNCVSPAPPDTISIQELGSLESVLLLIEGLSLDKPVECLMQFCESINELKLVNHIQKCLSLSHGNTQLVTNTLAVLILTLIYMPRNFNLVHDIVLGKNMEGRISNVELHKLLRNNEDASIRERTCVLLSHITRLNTDSLVPIWHQTLTNDIETLKDDPCPNVVQAATYASEVLKRTQFYCVDIDS